MWASINCMNWCSLSSWCLHDRKGAGEAAGVRGWVSAVWGWAQTLTLSTGAAAGAWTFISTLLGKEEPRIRLGLLRTQGHWGKKTKNLNVLLFASSFSSDFYYGLRVWRCFFNILRHYARIEIYFLFYFLYFSMSGIENITRNSFQYLWVFPFVSNFGCCYRCIIEVEITIFSH